MKARPWLQRYLRSTLLSAVSGLLAGTSAAALLWLLEIATRSREAHMQILWFLPFAGFAIGWTYLKFGPDIAPGTNLILDEIHDPKKTIPWRMAPFILLGTVATHLFGGSAGREGTAVQMGASLSDQLAKIFKLTPQDRKILLIAGMGAGFSAAIGAPWAGAIFGMEVLAVGRLRFVGWFESILASFVAYYTTVLLAAPHSIYAPIAPFELRWSLPFIVIFAGIIFGGSVRVFVLLTHSIERLFERFIHYSPLKPLVGGILLVTLYYLEGSYRYVGLGIPYIQQALTQPVEWIEPVLKTGFTALTIGSGFKGGEFIPLVYIGTTLGSFLSTVLPVSTSLLAALGFAAVFAGAANTPLACTVMAIEIFGPTIAPYALLACYLSYYCSGPHRIYQKQRYRI